LPVAQPAAKSSDSNATRGVDDRPRAGDPSVRGVTIASMIA
jgi:hypothetical protein